MELRDKHSTILQAKGVRIGDPALHIVNPEHDKYTSEIQAYVFDVSNNDIVDCIEFFVYFDGNYANSNNEVISWLEKEIPSAG